MASGRKGFSDVGVPLLAQQTPTSAFVGRTAPSVVFGQVR